MKIIKMVSEIVHCDVCSGTGEIIVKEYHNAYRACQCYTCRGSGKVEKLHQFDVTNSVLALMQQAGITELQHQYH
ncbi:MAG TPA: hypothetical protein PKE03_10370 [Bacteroidales bacterium]|nr:hypothetical protein [Bacteroidales bacterium]